MTSDYIFCNACGGQNEKGSEFCSTCGEKLTHIEQKNQDEIIKITEDDDIYKEKQNRNDRIGRLVVSYLIILLSFGASLIITLLVPIFAFAEILLVIVIININRKQSRSPKELIHPLLVNGIGFIFSVVLFILIIKAGGHLRDVFFP